VSAWQCCGRTCSRRTSTAKPLNGPRRAYVQRRDNHKYLIVLSDGAPVDDSTLYENGDAYLERHLLSVIHEIAQAGDIQLAAIGIGHAVECYYSRSIAVAAPEELEGAILRLIEQLLCSQPPT
jgi:cobaltochelatase CobT